MDALCPGPRVPRWAALFVALSAAPAFAQRPNEAELFGGASDAGVDAPARTSGPEVDGGSGGHGAEEGELFGGSGESSGPVDVAGDGNAVPNNPLQVGGQIYLRSQASAHRGDLPAAWTLQMPNLVDVYLDARPNERVRGFALGRMGFDPTVDPSAPSPFGGPKPAQLTAALDQLWLNFDVLQRVFVTAGKQHVKWGTGHFWNPTDFIEPVKRDPLAVFDARTGVTMVKAQVPWEKYGGNLVGLAVLEPALPADEIGHVGGALRGEIQVLNAALGAEAVVEKGRRPRFGADISRGVGPFDLYAEAALQSGADQPHWQLRQPPDPALGAPGLFEAVAPTGPQPRATGGLSWSTNLGDNDALTLGGEYFYNSLGYDDPKLYPWLMAQGQLTPFYLGKHYGGAYALLVIPGADSFSTNTFVFSTLGNLSDESFISRVDYSAQVLTHLRIELFGAIHYGSPGELRFGIGLPPQPLGSGQMSPPIEVPTPLFDLGIALRIAI